MHIKAIQVNAIKKKKRRRKQWKRRRKVKKKSDVNNNFYKKRLGMTLKTKFVFSHSNRFIMPSSWVYLFFV